MAGDVRWPDTTVRVSPNHDRVCCMSLDDPNVSGSVEPVVCGGVGGLEPMYLSINT